MWAVLWESVRDWLMVLLLVVLNTFFLSIAKTVSFFVWPSRFTRFTIGMLLIVLDSPSRSYRLTVHEDDLQEGTSTCFDMSLSYSHAFRHVTMNHSDWERYQHIYQISICIHHPIINPVNHQHVRFKRYCELHIVPIMKGKIERHELSYIISSSKKKMRRKEYSAFCVIGWLYTQVTIIQDRQTNRQGTGQTGYKLFR